jgi:hypothetical protein
VRTKRYPDDETKALSSFLSPSEVKGTAFLQWSHKNAPDEQWLYLPDLRRTRRITSDLSNESFMGTDFSYQDLGILSEAPSWTEADAPSTLVGEETVDGWPATSPCAETGGHRLFRIQVCRQRSGRATSISSTRRCGHQSLRFEGIENIGAFMRASSR